MSAPPLDEKVAKRKAQTKELVENLFADMRGLYKAAEKIPKSGGDFELYNSYPEFATLVGKLSEKMQSVSGNLFRAVRIREPRKGGLDSVDRMVEISDQLADKIALGMTKLSGGEEEGKLVIPARALQAEEIKSGREVDWSKYSALAAKVNPNAPKHNVFKISPNALLKCEVKPQFYDVEKANADVPFVRVLKTKHHAAKKPEMMKIHDEDQQGTSWQNDVDEDSAHPYEFEINAFAPNPERLVPNALGEVEVISMNNLKFVTTKKDIEELRDVLNGVNEFAVDIEHHGLRSFRGLVCLIQISTRSMDYIIDPFPLWNEMHILNEPFTDPKILKVFHGGECDIIWLQRDFGIYVVNMFDTGRAMRVLNYPKYGLAFLVKHFCDVDLDKQFQKCDWRIRPLTEEHMSYARCDTHYLLYCYDRLQNELIAKGNENNNLLKAVYDHSKEICLEVFENKRFNPKGYEQLLSGRRKLNKRQLSALSELWRWRDETARRSDESYEYVLPNHMLLSIAETLPREMQGILACCSPIPPPVRNELLLLHKIVFKARELPMDEKEGAGDIFFDSGFGDLSVALKNYELMLADANRITKVKSMLHTRLDFTNHPVDEEIRELPLKPIEAKAAEKLINFFGEVAKSQCFEISPVLDAKKVAAIREKQNEWATPYEHYEVALAEAEKEAERKRKIEEEEAKKRPKTMYTHLDEAAVRAPFEDTKETLATAMIPIDGEEAVPGTSGSRSGISKYDDNEILTKKGLKKKRKLIEKSADMEIGAGAGHGPDRGEASTSELDFGRGNRRNGQLRRIRRADVLPEASSRRLRPGVSERAWTRTWQRRL
ncbi:hypothetical protein L596_029647 [Steinernema carpocapsae]|uniref:HRDC domain-containing protein n=1 Tax=Steinernema carpocapsae TaxID=34508 RepID=A0A4U5LV95_STECR|nr:hypothetical protein L596_029647 [Steinernema carpocapsae]